MELSTRRGKQVLLLLGSVMFLGVGALDVIRGSQPSKGTDAHGSAADRVGQRHRDRRNKLGLIPWSEIASIEVQRAGSSPFSTVTVLALTMRNREAWMPRLPAVTQWSVRAGSRAGLGSAMINILVSGLDRRADEIVEEVRRHLP